MYQHLVVALDGSPEAEKVLPYVEALARAFGSTITLLGATESPEMVVAETLSLATPTEPAFTVDPLSIVNQERRDTAAYLSGLAARLRAQGIVVDYEHPEGPPAEVILATAERRGADLIAMTTHGRGGIGRLVFGSVADAVLRKTPCPMLLVRLDDPPAATPLTASVAEGAQEPAPAG